MRSSEVEEAIADPAAANPPKHVADSVEAGLDDLQKSRGVPGDHVLQKLDRMILGMDTLK